MTEQVQRALPATGLQFRHIGELDLTPPDWLVRGLIETEALVLLIGEPSSGKSFFALDVAACVATGTQWNGNRIKCGPVLYIAGEGQAGLARRRAAWEQQHGTDLAGAPLFVSTVPTSLTDAAAQQWLLQEVDKFQGENGSPLLIVVDTLARNFGAGDENDTRDMNFAVASIDDLRRLSGAAVLVAHHTGHADKGRGRGSTVLRAAADAEILLTRDATGVIRATVLKMKDAPTPAPMAFRLTDVDLGIEDSDGEPVISAALMPSKDLPTNPRALGKNQQRALDCLLELVAVRADSETVTVKAWQDACTRAGMHRSRFHEARNSLADAGTIRVKGENVWLCDSYEPVRIAQVSDGRTVAPGSYESVRIPSESHASGASGSSDPPYKGDRTSGRTHADQAADADRMAAPPEDQQPSHSDRSKHNGSRWRGGGHQDAPATFAGGDGEA